MVIPDKVKLLGYDIDVIRVNKKDLKKALGICNVDKNKILLRDNLEGDRLSEVFLHEVIHAVDNILDSGLTEKQVSTLSVGIYDFLKNNGLLKTV